MTPERDSPEDLRRRFPNAIRRDTPPELVPYRYQYYAAVLVGALSLVVGAIQAAGPSDLGFPPVAARWLGVLAMVLAGAAGVLPKLQQPPPSGGKG